MKYIRNFAIIAHVDHGKSTLADRFLEICGVLKKGNHRDQFLDRHPISQERGITIKLSPVRVKYGDYILNLIDTPGHVDFSYEVDRTLACVEGVILLVDATQGIQAQTLTNAYKAIEKNLAIIPVVNKIDLATAQIEKTKSQLSQFLGIKKDNVLAISAKTGFGVEELLKEVIEKIPPPKILNSSDRLSALIFDSYYDSHRGVITFVRMFSGSISPGQRLKLYHSKIEFQVEEVGYFNPDLTPSERLANGDIGYLVTHLKDIHQVRVGDTVIEGSDFDENLIITGYKKVKSMVFATIFPTDPNDFLKLKKAIEKLYLNDSSLIYKSVYSQALGAGYRVGFLGLLHADIVRERLEREFDLNLVLTPPQVEFEINEKGKIEEPIVKVIIITPNTYLGNIMQLTLNYRAKFLTMNNLAETDDLVVEYEMPMGELISDFFDRLKSCSSGYASLDWEFVRYQEVEAGKLELLINNDPVEEFSQLVVKEKAYEQATKLVKKLRELIPRQQFEVRIQAKFQGKIIASERIAPFRKNVLVKSGKVLGTGDIGRKMKLLERQKEGKKKMKMIGKVEVPKEAFIKLFKE